MTATSSSSSPTITHVLHLHPVAFPPISPPAPFPLAHISHSLLSPALSPPLAHVSSYLSLSLSRTLTYLSLSLSHVSFSYIYISYSFSLSHYLFYSPSHSAEPRPCRRSLVWSYFSLMSHNHRPRPSSACRLDLLLHGHAHPSHGLPSSTSPIVVHHHTSSLSS